jgi:hypothetical protein
MLDSDYRPLCNIRLPYAGRQRYMHDFDLADPQMEEGFEDYLDPVVALCRAAGAVSGIAHMTVDEKLVRAGMSQRRPRPHVDGRFVRAMRIWSHDPGKGSWTHGPDEPAPDQREEAPPRPLRMAVIVASSVVGCRAWRGRFDGQPAHDGDLSHISDRLGDGEVLPPGVAYLLSPDCVHESMLMDRDVERTFLRIALPLDFDFGFTRRRSPIQETAPNRPADEEEPTIGSKMS